MREGYCLGFCEGGYWGFICGDLSPLRSLLLSTLLFLFLMGAAGKRFLWLCVGLVRRRVGRGGVLSWTAESTFLMFNLNDLLLLWCFAFSNTLLSDYGLILRTEALFLTLFPFIFSKYLDRSKQESLVIDFYPRLPSGRFSFCTCWPSLMQLFFACCNYIGYLLQLQLQVGHCDLFWDSVCKSTDDTFRR